MTPQQRTACSALLLSSCVCIGISLSAFASDATELLKAGDWKPGTEINGLYVGSGCVEAAMDAAKAEGVTTFVILQGRELVRQAREKIDATGQYARTVFVREATMNDTRFPDYFFHHIVVLDDKHASAGKELWRILRPGKAIVLAQRADNSSLSGKAERTTLTVKGDTWHVVRKPSSETAWPMSGGQLKGNTTTRAYHTSSESLKPPLKLQWLSTSCVYDAYRSVAANGYFAVGGEVRDAYTGQKLPLDLKGAVRSMWPGTFLVRRGSRKRPRLVALDERTLNEKWSIPNGYAFHGLFRDKIITRRPARLAKGASPRDRFAAFDRETGEKRPLPDDLQVKGPLSKLKYGLTPIKTGLSPKGEIYKYTDTHVVARSWVTRAQEGEKPKAWFDLGSLHTCSPLVSAGEHMWWVLGYGVGVGGFKLSEPGNRVKMTAWYHPFWGKNCNGPAIAMGHLYVSADFKEGAACFAPDRLPARLTYPPHERLEKGEAPPNAPTAYDPADWPMSGYNPARTSSCADKTITPQLGVLWAYNAKASITGAPVVVNDTAYFGTADHKLHAVDINTQERKWLYFAGAEIRSAPCVWGGMVFFGADDGWFTCLNAATGKLVWRLRAEGPDEESPSITGMVPRDFPIDYRAGRGEIGPRSEVRSAFFLNGKAMMTPWAIRGAPMVVNGKVYFGAGIRSHNNIQGCVYCLDARTGKVVWKKRTYAGQAGPTAYKRGKIYYWNYNLEAVDAETGSRRSFAGPYMLRVSKPGSGRVALSDHCAFTGRGCFSLIDGAPRGERVGYSHVIANGRAYADNRRGQIAVYSSVAPRTQNNAPSRYGALPVPELKAQKTFSVGGKCVGMAEANGFLFCATKTKLIVLDKKSGRVASTTEIPGGQAKSFAISRGKLFLGTDAGQLLCFSKAEKGASQNGF